MLIKKLLGMNVIDTNAKVLGKVHDVDFNESIGEINSLIIAHKNNLVSNKEIIISYDQIENIGDYILLKITIDLETN
jgi:sporulation protein YlmC with PRC-barrel domain